jgi:hypothetical protein
MLLPVITILCRRQWSWNPFTALGLASNIVQFVDFGSKLISESRELYKSASGTTIESKDLRKATENLQQFCDKLVVPRQTASTATRFSKEESLRNLTISCKDTAFALLLALRELAARGSHKKWQSIRVALKSVQKKSRSRSWQAHNPYHEGLKTWTRSELLQAFTRLGSRDISLPRFCFFIDGLDEYEGDHSGLVNVLKDLVDSSSVKICLSMRKKSS